MLGLLFTLLSTITFAEVPAEVIERCNFGYRSMERLKPGAFQDIFGPDSEVTPRELCETLFNDNQANENYAWLKTTIAHLKIPAGEVKLRELSSAEGQCRIGALIYLKKHLFDLPVPAKHQLTLEACQRFTP